MLRHVYVNFTIYHPFTDEDLHYFHLCAFGEITAPQGGERSFFSSS